MNEPSLALRIVFSSTIAVLSHSLFRVLFHRTVRVSDTLFHLKMIDLTKRLGWRKVCETRPDYPLGFHWLVSHLPKRAMPVWEWLNGGVVDALHVAVFAVVLTSVGGGRSLLWGPVLLALHPGWLHVAYGPRAYDGTERTFAELLTALTFSGAWCYMSGAGWGWAALAVGSGAALLNSSKFGAQVLLFFSLVIAVLYSFWSLLLPPASFAAALLLSRGTYLEVFRGQLSHLRWYMHFDRSWAMSRNSWTTLVAHWRREGYKGILRYVLVTNSVTVAGFQNVPLIVVLLAAAAGVGHLPTDRFALSWLVAGGTMWFLTSLPRLLFLGEPERYLLNAAVPAYFFIAGWLNTVAPIWAWSLLAYSLIWWMVQQVILVTLAKRKRRTKAETAYLQGLIEALQGIPRASLMTVGGSFFNWELAYRTHHRHWQTEAPAISFKELFSCYPYPKWSAVAALDIDIVAVSKKELQSEQRQYVADWPFGDLPVVFENDHYLVYATSDRVAMSTPVQAADKRTAVAPL